MNDFEMMTKTRLIQLCRLRNLYGYSNKTRDELIEIIKNNKTRLDKVRCNKYRPSADEINEIKKEASEWYKQTYY